MAAGGEASSLADVRGKLERRREELMALIDERRRSDQPVAPDRAIGRLTRQDALQQQEMAAALVRRHEQELVRVQKALHAIEQGTYGSCVRCGNRISDARLTAVPYANTCLVCADR